MAKGKGMRRAAVLAMLICAGAAMSAISGCAYVTAQPVKPGDKVNGIRYYDVKPLLVVSGQNVTVQYVPNYSRGYALRFGAFLAKNDFEANVGNGVLTSVKANMDTTALVDLLKTVADKIPVGFSGPPAPATPGGVVNRFQVYDLVFDDAGNLTGLKPLVKKETLLTLETAGGGGGGATVAPQPKPTTPENPAPVTPGPVKKQGT